VENNIISIKSGLTENSKEYFIQKMIVFGSCQPPKIVNLTNKEEDKYQVNTNDSSVSNSESFCDQQVKELLPI
jgi:hypothetical protein